MFHTPIKAIWKLPSLYTLMYLQIICFCECIIKHTTGVCTFHSMYPMLKRKKGLILLFWKEVKHYEMWITNQLHKYYIRRLLFLSNSINLWIHINSKDGTNSVSKFGGILTLLLIKLLWLAIVQDPWRSGFHSGARMYPSIY